LEFLGEPVPDTTSSFSTNEPGAAGDHHVVPANRIPLTEASVGQVWDQTMESRDDQDTYDNDVDLLAVGIPGGCYDQTSFTKTEGETYDDDNSVESLSFPTS
jgi:hypothetical protein